MPSAKENRFHIPDEKIQAAEKYVATLERPQWLALTRLVADALWELHGTQAEWQPYQAALDDAGLDRGKRNDLVALMSALMQRSTRPEPVLRRGPGEQP